MSKVFDLDIDGNSEKAIPREIAYDPTFRRTNSY